MIEERDELPLNVPDLFNDFGFRTLGSGQKNNGNFLLDFSLPSAFHIDHNVNYHHQQQQQQRQSQHPAGDSRFESTHIEIEQLVDDASESSGADRTAAAATRCDNTERNCAESMIGGDGEEVEMDSAPGFDEDESEMQDEDDDISSISSSSSSSSTSCRDFENESRSSAGSRQTNRYDNDDDNYELAAAAAADDDDSSSSTDPISGKQQQHNRLRPPQDQDDYRLQNNAEKIGIADNVARRENNMKQIDVNKLQNVSKIADNDNDYANKANLLQSRSKNVCEFPSKYEKSSNDDPTIGYTNNSDLVNENDELKEHVNASLRNNIDGKIFVCTICLVYSTQRRYYMVNHIKKHLGITNLCCDKCNYTTVWNSDMRRHIRKVHVKRL
ncbi:MAG: hypothetical protein MHMPM18_000977 [Marteilia pararefringens]